MKGRSLSTIPAQKKTASSTSPKTVLVVEDDTIFLNAVRTKLHRKGCRVLTAKNVSEAEEKWAMARDIIHVVISDHKLGFDFGSDLVQRFQQQAPNVQFVLCSGDPLSDPVPGIPFLPKPFNVDLIIGT